MSTVRVVALPIAVFFGVFCLGSVLLQPATAPVQPEPVQSTPAPAAAHSRVLDILAAEAQAVHDGTISPAEFNEWQARMEAAGAADAADAPGDDVVLAAAIGTTPDVVRRLRDSFREDGISGNYTDRLLYGIAEQVRQGS